MQLLLPLDYVQICLWQGLSSPVTSCVACSHSPLPCRLLQRLWCGTSACAACSGPCQTRHFEMWICANPGSLLWNNSYQQHFTHYNAMTHMQRKEKGARLSPVVDNNCDCHPGFNFALVLIAGSFVFFLIVCSVACSRPFCLFFCTCSAHHWGWACLYFSFWTPGRFQIQSSKRSLLGALDCFKVLVMALLHTNSIIQRPETCGSRSCLLCVW